ncbi:MAG TPA: class I SAM-dependent methyltransferase [Longimicrobium sp.]|nr:class I SAM-dependent methyltransferase [Longimicrobium sp.]
MNDSAPSLREHNRQQIDYFERTLKRTMVPAETPYVRRHVEELVAFAGLGPDDRVLEVGCGMGRYTLPLARRGVNVEGLDLAPGLLERLREYAGGLEIPLHCADIIDHPAELKGRFDAVVGFFTLHHLHDLDLCFAAMAQLVRPGGRIVFLEPNAYNPLYYIQILATPRMTWEGDGGIVQMRRHPVFGAMRRAGLEKQLLRRFGFFPPFLANRPGGAAAERVLERVPLWRAALPFQLFRADRPAAPAG